MRSWSNVSEPHHWEKWEILAQGGERPLSLFYYDFVSAVARCISSQK